MARVFKKVKSLVPFTSLSSQRIHLLINLKLDNGVEDVFENLIAQPKGKENVYLQLDKKTNTGDTLLHRLVQATADHPEDMDLYMQLMDVITTNSVTWWCKKEKLNPSNDDLQQKYKRDAMLYLLTELKDAKSRTVWKLAFEVVSVEMIRKLLYLDGVTCCRKQDEIYFDMSQFDRQKTGSNCILNICNMYCNFNHTQTGLAELLNFAKEKEKVAEILSIKPINKLVDMYSSFTTKLYVLIVFLHIVYMAVFSYAGCELMDSTNPNTNMTTKVLLYSIGLTEPFVLTLYLICDLIKCVAVMCGSCHSVDKTNYLKRFIARFPVVLVHTVLVLNIVARVDQDIRTIDRNVLSVCLLIGWLWTLALADGIQPIHFFFRLVMKVMATDILKVLLVYVIFLTGFSLSIHAQFIATTNITSTYHNPVDTMFLMFNVMMGLEHAIDSNTEYYLSSADASVLLSKILYIGYTICCAIVLINLLIAMMNTSYAKVNDEHAAEWVCKASLFGIRTSEYFPALSRRFGVNNVHYGHMFKNTTITDKGLYLVLDKEDLEEDENRLDSLFSDEIDIQQVGNDVKLSERRLRNQISEISNTQKKMMECIQDLQVQISQLK